MPFPDIYLWTQTHCWSTCLKQLCRIPVSAFFWCKKTKTKAKNDDLFGFMFRFRHYEANFFTICRYFSSDREKYGRKEKFHIKLVESSIKFSISYENEGLTRRPKSSSALNIYIQAWYHITLWYHALIYVESSWCSFLPQSDQNSQKSETQFSISLYFNGFLPQRFSDSPQPAHILLKNETLKVLVPLKKIWYLTRLANLQCEIDSLLMMTIHSHTCLVHLLNGWTELEILWWEWSRLGQ